MIERCNFMSKLSLITAIYKNEGNIIPFYENFNKEIAPYLDDYEIIMVNDYSPDDSWSVMKELAQRDKHVKIIKLSRNFGAYEANYIGYTYATGDCVTVKAVDLQEPAELTVSMYQKWKEGAKIVLAVRENRYDSAFTKFSSNLYYKIMQNLVSKAMPSGGFDTYLIDREVANLIVDMEERNSPISLQLLWVGYEPIMVPYTRKKREIGKSSWSFAKKFKLFMDSIISFSFVPVRFMSMVGLITLIGTVAYSIYLIISRLVGRTPYQGYTTLTVLILFFSGLVMFTLGILGEYIWRILENTRKRPVAVIAETMNIEEKDGK